MIYSKTNRIQILFFLFLMASLHLTSQSICTWHPEKKELEFSLERISGILNCDLQKEHGKSHHFSNVIHKPTGTKISPDEGSMAGTGMLNFFRVLIEGGYLTELRVEEPLLEPTEDGIICTWMPTIRRQAKVKVKFTFRQPNIIDMDMWVETLTNYPAFEILLSAYMAPGFESGVYVAKEEFGPIEAEQIRVIDQPMIHGIWPFFPRDEAGANLLTDGRHQKGRWFWRMAIGRRYAMPFGFFSKNGVDAILMGRPEDVYAVGATYKGDPENDNVAGHRSLYLSLFGEDFKAGEGRHTQMRMIIDDFGSDAKKHKELFQSFLKDTESKPRSFQINPAPKTK
ncbi:hypothetical protein [Pareuzebyella sediminis]|uniref:hypothetical protein n=1 Tax=Pareuzebyella sediminis TaxID=2607998 RepID=UPI0011EEAAFA|nr:hypothetical protein [Pareuzebyella sediminis]